MKLNIDPKAALDRKRLALLRQAMLDAHPDRGGSHAAFIKAKKAYDDAKQTPPVLQARLKYAACGWWTFPAPANGLKKSLKWKLNNGVNWGATLDPEVIRGEFNEYPGGFFTGGYAKQNVGIVTGRMSGIFVIECDTSEHGEGINGAAALRRWESQRGKLPPTLMARSPSGSVHYYFRHPGKVYIKSRAHILGPGSGVDCKADGGMVLAPPSYRPPQPASKGEPAKKGGYYTWINEEHEIAEPPRWLLNLVTVKVHAHSPDEAHSNSRGVNHPADPALVRYALHQYRWELLVASPIITSGVYDPYRVWFETAAALRAEFGDTALAFGLFDEWSSSSPHYSKSDCRAKWKGVANTTRSQSPPSFTMPSRSLPVGAPSTRQGSLKRPPSFLDL